MTDTSVDGSSIVADQRDLGVAYRRCCARPRPRTWRRPGWSRSSCRSCRPVLAITGTNGKTTVTTLVDAMLEASGVRSAAVGNTEVPLIAAIEDPSTEVFVVEASLASAWRRADGSAEGGDLAQLRRGPPGRARLAGRVPLCQGPDLGRPGARRRRGRQLRGPGGALASAPRRGPTGRATFASGWAPEPDGVVPDYREVYSCAARTRRDRAAACSTSSGARCPTIGPTPWAAAATVLAGRASRAGVRTVLVNFSGLSHRVQLVGTRDGVRWFDDSKATAPHATLAAVAGFDSVVLIAGGRNKGLDLGALGAAGDRVRGP